MKRYILLLITLAFGILNLLATDSGDIIWLKLDHGVYYADIDMPKTSFVGDSRAYIIRINPIPYKFEIHRADKAGKKRYSPAFWANRVQLVSLINACQIVPETKFPLGFLQVRRYTANRKINPDMKMMLLLDPWEGTKNKFDFVLTDQEDFEEIKGNYRTAVQGIEVVNDGKALDILNTDTASFVSVGKDNEGNMLFIFSRSPYRFSEVGELLLKLPIGLEHLMITEKGPRAAMYFNNELSVINKIGSYESGFFISDDNNEDPTIPFVLGIRRETR